MPCTIDYDRELMCGSDFAPCCVGLTLTMSPVGFQQFIGEATSAATFMVGAAIMFGAQEMNPTQMRAANALRCMLTSLGENTWNFLASAWFAAKQFGKENELKDYINIAYPHICTCNEDAAIFAFYMMMSPDPAHKAMMADIFSACTESAQVANENNGSA